MISCVQGRHILRIVKKLFNSECEFYLPFVNIISLCNCNNLIQHQFSEVVKQTSSEKHKLIIYRFLKIFLTKCTTQTP